MTDAARVALADGFAKLAAGQTPKASSERKENWRWTSLLRRQTHERAA